MILQGKGEARKHTSMRVEKEVCAQRIWGRRGNQTYTPLSTQGPSHRVAHTGSPHFLPQVLTRCSRCPPRSRTISSSLVKSREIHRREVVSTTSGSCESAWRQVWCSQD
jgi:hypothetical protein